MKRYIAIVLSILLFSACEFLDPLANGNYTESNIDDYPTLLRGYINSAYLQLPNTYCQDRFLFSEGATDNAVMRDKASRASLFATGNSVMTDDMFSDIWSESYTAIMNCNTFLKDNVGFQTRYYVDAESDRVLRHCLQGDAFGLRAFFHATLLAYFGGKGTNGELLGVPLMTEVVDVADISNYQVKRATYDECVAQIIKDCDSALAHLPLANRDFLKETSETAAVTGAVRYKALDRVSIHALKAMVYLRWASPAFNPGNDMSRYDLAAKEAAFVMDHKLTKESTVVNGFNPAAGFFWTDPNSPEAVFVSRTVTGSTFEEALYPYSFGGTSTLGPTQELVDAFPAADGYPISKSAVYDPTKPYENRDPRFYAAIYYDKAQVIRSSNGKVMYTFDIADGGRDAIGGQTTSPTGYYVKKFLYTNWNASDADVQKGTRSIFFFDWTQMCLAFAEAANKVVGPTDSGTYGFSARQALAYLRARSTSDGTPGIGATADPYLDECAAAGKEAFDALVRNEWRIETCFEGNRMLDLRRWGLLDQLNKSVSGVTITGSTYTHSVVESRSFASLWLPIPYLEMRKSDQMVQNEGWESYK